MKRLVAGTLAVVAVVGAVWIAQSWATQKARLEAVDTDKAVLDADAALRRALVAGERNFAGSYIDRRFILVDRTGSTFAKSEIVRRAAGDGEPDAERAVRRYGRVAVVSGRSGMAGVRLDTFFVHVWVKRRTGWRALAFQESAIVVEAAPAPGAGLFLSSLGSSCDNPCKSLPFRPKNAAEREIVAAFQAIESAVVANDADAWARHIADEFTIHGAQAPSRSKADRLAYIRARTEARAITRVAEVQSMQLWTFGDAAVMTAQHGWTKGVRPPYRATRVWVRRDGRWQMALSQQTPVEP